MFIVGANLSPVCTSMTLSIKGQHVGTMKTSPPCTVFLRDSLYIKSGYSLFLCSICCQLSAFWKIKTIASGSHPGIQRRPCTDLESEGLNPALILLLRKPCKSFFLFWPVYWLMTEREYQLLHLVIEKSKWKTASESIYKP